MTALIEDGLRLMVAESRKTRSKPQMPRISKSTGGVWPGVDVIRSSGFEEVDDLEVLQRIEPRG